MHFFKGQYFKVNRRFLVLVGLWPYETETKTLVRTVVIGTMIVSLIPHFISVAVHRNDVDRLMLGLISILTVSVAIFKAIGLVTEEEEMKKLYESIADNWLKIEDECEREILHEYSERGRLLTLLMSVFMSGCFSVTLLPLVPKILDKLYPLPDPRPDMYVLEGEFFVDREAHFAELYLVDCVTFVTIIVVAIAVDTTYVASSQHCCALYAIVSYRLKKLRRTVLSDCSAVEDGDSYDWLVRTVQVHQKALTFTLTLNQSYSTTLLLTIPPSLFAIPFASCAILANLQNLLHLLPYAVYFVALTVHLFILCWPGQMILDHGIELGHDAYRNEWYAAPLRTKKLLLILMQRSSQPATIEAGGLFTLNYQTFFLVMRTAVSYITVAASFR